MSVYFIRNETTRNVKIGHSESLERRLRQLQQGNDCKLTLIAEIPGDKGLEKVYHDTWHAYRIVEEGEHGDEWFSIAVHLVGEGVEITGRKKYRSAKKIDGRRSGKGRLKHQLCLRLSDRQLELLNAYAGIKGFKSNVEAVRNIIDGLDKWLRKQPSEGADSGPSSASLVSASIASDARVSDVRAEPSPTPADDDGASLGDFGGQPRLKLPGLPSDD